MALQNLLVEQEMNDGIIIISCFTTFDHLDPDFIFELIIFFCYGIELYTCGCSIRVTAVFEYIKSAFYLVL